MKKGKITMIITIAISCFALVFIMCMQFKLVRQTDITSIETMRQEELRLELANWKQMYKQAEEQYEEKVSRLNEYEKNQKSAEESAKLVEETLEQTNMFLAKTEVEGQGIEITIKDVKDDDIKPIAAEDLLIIVDYLKLAGAEAISINGERIVNMSDIVDIADSIIRINQQRILSPYVIKAIGDPTNLESTLMGNGGYIETLKSIGFEANIERENKIIIPKYNKEIGYKYIQ